MNQMRRLNNLKDILGLLELTINEVRTGEIAPDKGRTIGYLSSILRHVMEKETIEEKLCCLEKEMKRRKEILERINKP